MDKKQKAVEKRIKRKLRNLGMKHKQALEVLEHNRRFIGTRHVGVVDDAEYGSKAPQMSLLEARVKLCEPKEEVCSVSEKQSWSQRLRRFLGLQRSQAH